MRTVFILFAMVCLNLTLLASSGGKQEIRGKIIDKVTGLPLAGVTVTTTNPKISIGTISDENGEFNLWDIPSDLLGLKISLNGYKTTIVDNPVEFFKEGLPLVIELENNIILKKKLPGVGLLKNQKMEMDTSIASRK